MSDAEQLTQLRTWATRSRPDGLGYGPHQYDGGCPWCRADNAEFLGGGAHEHALALIESLEAERVRTAQLTELVRELRDEAIDTLGAEVAGYGVAFQRIDAVLGVVGEPT